MSLTYEQLPVLAVFAATVGSTALLTGLLALLAATRTVTTGGRPLVGFMASNAVWCLGIVFVMLPIEPLARAVVFHWIWVAAAVTTAMWIRAILAFVGHEDRILAGIRTGLFVLAGMVTVDALATLGGFSLLTRLQPMQDPGLMVLAAGNQVSFLPGTVVMGSSWALAVLVSAVLLGRRIWRHAPAETALLIGVGITGFVSVLDGVTAALPYAVAVSFAANLVEAVVLTAAQIRRVSTRLAEVERARLEQQVRLNDQLTQLRELQRLSMLGARTARISHDLRNPLTVVLAGVEQMEEMLLGAGHEADKVEEITRLTSRALESTLELTSGFTRPMRKAAQPEVFEVGACIDDALLLCSLNLEGVDVQLERVPARVIGQPGELTQVLVNLIQNAAEAMSELDERWLRVRVATEGQSVSIEVVNAGPRPPDAVLQKMFHTPFTTKGQEGTGLGLDICRHVVTEMGGHIGVDARAAHTTIHMELPRVQADVQSRPTAH